MPPLFLTPTEEAQNTEKIIHASLTRSVEQIMEDIEKAKQTEEIHCESNCCSSEVVSDCQFNKGLDAALSIIKRYL